MKTANTKSGTTADKTTEPNAKKKASGTGDETKQASRQESQNKMPDWVMHLLTGAGAIGGNYMLFIKPLQEKLEAMDTAIKQQEKTIQKLQEQIDLLSHRLKKTSISVDDEIKAEPVVPVAENELFSLGSGGREIQPDLSKKTRVFRF